MDPEGQKYNTVYEKLVQHDDDLVGLIAYALYKQNKRDWLVEHRNRKAKDPTEAEMSAYLTSQQLDGTVRMYRERAAAVLDEFGKQVIDRATPDIQRDAVAGSIEKSLSWWRQIPTGIASALVYTILLIVIAIVLRHAGIDLLGIVSSLGK
jgi:hypothetical protein